MSTLEQQNECIKEVLSELSEFLCKKNTSYGGSVFQDCNYDGKIIDAEQTINLVNYSWF